MLTDSCPVMRNLKQKPKRACYFHWLDFIVYNGNKRFLEESSGFSSRSWISRVVYKWDQKADIKIWGALILDLLGIEAKPLIPLS